MLCSGGTVHLVCRNEERGKEAKEAIIKETKNDVRFYSMYLMLCTNGYSFLESPFTSLGHV